jgi:hypothetical protein
MQRRSWRLVIFANLNLGVGYVTHFPAEAGIGNRRLAAAMPLSDVVSIDRWRARHL